MARNTESWFEKAADLMVRRGVGLREAAAEINVVLGVEEAAGIRRSKAFEAILWNVRNAYFLEVGSNPGLRRDGIVGKMWVCADKLLEDGEYDKAAEVLLKVAKIKNFVGPEQQTNIFGNLSQEDLNRIREKAASLAKGLTQ